MVRGRRIVAWSPEDSLVIGISSRALLKLDEENSIYQISGTQAFIDHQREHEEEIIGQGVAFPLIEALLGLNNTLARSEKPAIEVVIISKNHPDCGVRVKRSLTHHGIKIKRAVFTGGQDPLPYLRAYQVDLFLSKEEAAVKAAIADGIPAGLIHGGPENPKKLDGTPVFAFDGDAVLFSDVADQVYKQESMAGFAKFEFENVKTSLPPGPLHNFARALEEVRRDYPIDSPPFRIVLVTARDFEYCERPMRTLRECGIRVDQAFYCGDMSKSVVLSVLRPLIFFDDSQKNCADASISTPTARVPVLEEKFVVTLTSSNGATDRPDRFLGVCKIFLKKRYGQGEPLLRKWHEDNLSGFSDEAYANFIAELERSAKGTPSGRQRRAAGARNEDFTKLLQFLEPLRKKYA